MNPTPASVVPHFMRLAMQLASAPSAKFASSVHSSRTPAFSASAWISLTSFSVLCSSPSRFCLVQDAVAVRGMRNCYQPLPARNYEWVCSRQESGLRPYLGSVSLDPSSGCTT
ncbi:hypothetical protein BJX66DRAFT_116533 [Aspergillus keveii]|uniref:Secreted protein n=1 Tax=Aspergillus keveii TaxID=714993 RepID=A0ABR4FKA1_9EURO